MVTRLRPHPLPVQDMIHIADTKIARRFGDYFLRQINKMQEVSTRGTLPLNILHPYS